MVVLLLGNPSVNHIKIHVPNLQKLCHIFLFSGPNDHVFVNFVDHGGPGILGFPMGVLHAQPLVDTLKEMHSDKKFKQVVRLRISQA